MDVSLPIRAVVPTLDGPVLAVLAATTAPVSLAETHRRSGEGSKSGIRRVLLRLVDEGLVLEVPGGYRLNREHVAAPAVELLTTLQATLTARIRDEVQRWAHPPTLVGLFGSAARRDGDASSDIDLLVAAESDVVEEVGRLGERIEAWTGNMAQIVVVTPADVRRLRRAGEPIVEAWDRDLTVVFGDRRALEGRR